MTDFWKNRNQTSTSKNFQGHSVFFARIQTSLVGAQFVGQQSEVATLYEVGNDSE